MSYKVFLIGCGAVGKVISYYLSSKDGVEHITIGDIAIDNCRKYIEWLNSDKISLERVDASDISNIYKTGQGSDIFINAVTPEYNLSILRASIESKSHYIDLAFGPPYDNLDKMFKLNSELIRNSLTAVTGSGIAPGLTNVMASLAVDELDHIDSIKVRIYGELKTKKYISTWSPRTFLQDCMLKPIIIENGVLVAKEPFTGEEIYEFPYLGAKKVWLHAHEEPLMFFKSFKEKNIKYSDVKMGNLETIKVFYDIGILSDKMVRIDGTEKKSWEILAELIPPPPSIEEIDEMVKEGIIEDSHGVILVEVNGERGGKRVREILWTYDPGIRRIIKEYPMATNVSYLAGINAAVLAHMMGEGLIIDRGLILPETLDKNVRIEYINRLRRLKPPIKIYRRKEWML